ncbi:endonuclease/exonuclease/phosphatase family protein [Jatrophihabitans sp.]|uniref:endonuclease/exonuclease/phosphatase family protein n=1 Tax=Jatrophihabitans sp. TaxID=1932789 RepID=UPI002C1C88A8|nr:endonuclease/exonuclease/phosphatase family protein [Jatrophihabitans sp.]
MTTLRLLSYNVRSMRDDVDALGRVMREIAPDVAIIQEAPRFLRWRYQCAALARRAGLVLVTGGRACGANLVLSSLAVDVLDTYELAFSVDRRLHHRGSAVAVLRRAGARFAVAGTHLDLIEAPRLRHLDELADFTARFVPADVPLIVGGDINAVPASATWQRLQRFGTDAFAAAGTGDGFTYSTVAPVRRIDGVFADPRLQLLKAETVDTADVRIASDHRPLVVEYLLADAQHVELPGQAER